MLNTEKMTHRTTQNVSVTEKDLFENKRRKKNTIEIYTFQIY